MPGRFFTAMVTLLFIVPVIVMPFVALLLCWFDSGLSQLLETMLDTRVLSALYVSLVSSLAAVLINMVIGLLLAWVLVRYSFSGKRLMNAVIDLPLALPTAVAGLALLTLCDSGGAIGTYFLQCWEIDLVYNQTGMVIGMVFVTLPFAVRTVQPVLEDIPQEVEEAAKSLGALPFSIFFRVILPRLIPSLSTGACLVFSRALGEFGAMIFLAGNIMYESEYLTLLIVLKLDEYDYVGASAVALSLTALALIFYLLSRLVVSICCYQSERGGAEYAR
ncbi:sulfate ABC transporter permease subunit CysT [Endozoicomonadaceae bacterium StTr2]